jgi:hypothetical protein
MQHCLSEIWRVKDYLETVLSNQRKRYLFRSKWGSLDVRTALEVQKEQEQTDQIMNKLFENPKFRNAVQQALRVLK